MTKVAPKRDFISLREFLLLRDLTEHDGKFPSRSIHRNETLGAERPSTVGYFNNELGPDFVNRYDIAKTSWEKYGDKGPPVGSRVTPLSRYGVIGIFHGEYSDDTRFFTVKIRGTAHIYERTYWWAFIRVIEP